MRWNGCRGVFPLKNDEMIHHGFESRQTHGVLRPLTAEISLPAFQHPDACQVQVSDGTFEIDRASQLLRYWHTPPSRLCTTCAFCPADTQHPNSPISFRKPV